ncbi:MAG: hypothetical protein ACHREM_06720 [Polyangiales bacterium]
MAPRTCPDHESTPAVALAVVAWRREAFGDDTPIVLTFAMIGVALAAA